MAWQNKKSNPTFGIVLAIAIQAFFVAGLMIALRVVDTDGILIGDIQLQPTDDPAPPQPQPPIDPPRNPNPDPDAHPIPLPPVPPCEDCGPTNPGPADGYVYPTPGFGAGRPDYPATDKRLGHEGTVTVNVCVDERGSATSAKLRKSSGYPLMDRSAVEWAQRIRWRPGKIDGRVSAMCFDQGYRFRLENG